MGKYDDRHSAGRSRTCPYRPGETSNERHERRLQTNLRARDRLDVWCRAHDLSLKVANRRQHWQIRGKGLKADWWPSSAKLVVQGRWQQGIHAHDYQQVIHALSKEIYG